jgi:acyl-CoA thioester hydrolase
MHTTEVKVRFSELDPYGHVNHAIYLTYLETARVDALDSLGLSLERLRSEGFHLIVVEVAVRFHAPARHGDVLAVDDVSVDIERAESTMREGLAIDGGDCVGTIHGQRLP